MYYFFFMILLLLTSIIELLFPLRKTIIQNVRKQGLRNRGSRGSPGTMPWRSQNIEHHRTPELFSHLAKIYYLDNWNSLSNSCHVMPWQIYSIMEKNDTVKSGIFEKNQLKGFFFFQIYHPKLMSQKYNFEFFYDSALLIDPIMRLKFSFFSCPEFKFLRGS